MKTLEQCLVLAGADRLEVIARSWKSSLLKPWRDTAAVLAQDMLAPGRLEAVWSELSPFERGGLAALGAAGGTIPWLSFVRRWGVVREMGPGRMLRERPWEAPASPAEGLWYRGLLFRTLIQGPTGCYEAAVLPEDLLSRLPGVSPDLSISLEQVSRPPVVLSAEDSLLDDACTLLAYLQNHSVRPGSGGEWPAPDVARLTVRLRDTDPDRRCFLRHLAGRLSWLRAERSGALRPDAEQATAWLQAPASEQRAILACGWRDDPTWNDLWHVSTLRPDNTGSWQNDPLVARHAVLRHLADSCVMGEWYSLASFAAVVKHKDPDFQRPDGDYDTWYIRDQEAGEHLVGFAGWDKIEGALIRYLLTGPLFWLGVADLGRQNGASAVSTFCLTPTAASLVGWASDVTLDGDVAPITVQSNLTVLAPAARRYERFQLSRVADWVRSGDPYVYRLTPASLERARSQKITPARVKAFLEEAAGAEAARRLQIALDRWAEKGQEVYLELGVVLRVHDESLLHELVTAPSTRHLIREVIGATAALVALEDWPRLADALAERGLLPDLVRLEGSDEG